ncbi:MAG: hypothetical protein KC983_01410 [Phycisphaerales bacterium]|nr:hypothetical protein [Phycisphaerales bacterium]
MLGLTVDRRKVKAAARSFPQFCPIVRLMFPGDADDDVIEASTVFLYEKLTEVVFGKRFVQAMRQELGESFKFASAAETAMRVARIDRLANDFEKIAMSGNAAAKAGDFTEHVCGVIRSMLAEAGYRTDDPELLRQTFPRFDHAVRRMKSHLTGIKQQNHFIMG